MLESVDWEHSGCRPSLKKIDLRSRRNCWSGRHDMAFNSTFAAARSIFLIVSRYSFKVHGPRACFGNISDPTNQTKLPAYQIQRSLRRGFSITRYLGIFLLYSHPKRERVSDCSRFIMSSLNAEKKPTHSRFGRDGPAPGPMQIQMASYLALPKCTYPVIGEIHIHAKNAGDAFDK